ncbi:MAG: efflux RND transporter periplasmic adaptor subunit [Candidatus Poribacteria bacterium]|nr:efflux RND transporter periplasmic adaptor subunit [Candidatus Poribacteria bacterium]
MRKKTVIICIIVVGIIGVGGYLLYDRLFSSTKEESNNSGMPELRTATVERGDIDVVIDATGTIEPLNIVEVSSKASGKILSLSVEEGDAVEKDDVIARIETTYVAVDLEQAEADLRASQARLKQAEINIQLQKDQSEIQIKQAEEKLAESKKQLEQLSEQIRIEKEKTNKRQVADAENNLKIASLRFKLLTSETVRAEEINRANAAVNQAEANRDLAKKEYERKKGLFEKNLISQSELDAAETQLQSAEAQHQSAVEQAKLVKQPASEAELKLAQAEIDKAKFALDAALEQIEKQPYRDMEIEIQSNRVEQAKESLNLAVANKAQISVKEKELENAQAQVKRSEGQLQLAREQMSDTEIRAPISGTVLEKRVEEGQIIFSSFGGGSRSSFGTSEGQVIVTMADLSRVYVVTEVDETDIGKVKVGQPATITVEAYPDQPFEGEILRISPQGQVVQNVTTFNVISEIKNTRAEQRGRFRRGAGGFNPEQREQFQRMRGQRDETGAAEDSRTENRGADSSDDVDPWMAMMDSFMGDQPSPAGADEQDVQVEAPFLKPGMNATVQISAASRRAVLVLPNEAIISFGNRKMIRPISEDGQPGRPQPVVTGAASFDTTEVVSGAEEGQRVAIGGGRPSGSDADMQRFRRMMQNPASTMRRMGGGFGGRGRGR